MEANYKEVSFALYCKKCINNELEGYKSPCNECLDVPMREGTNVPEKYEANEKRQE